MKKTRRTSPAARSHGAALQSPSIALLRQAMLLFSQGQVSEALRVAEHGLAFDAQNVELCNLAGICAATSGDEARAEQCWRQAIAVAPRYAEAHANLGLLLANRKQAQEAEACYRRAIALNPKQVDALCNLANLLAESGRREESEQHYQRVIALAPRYAEAYANLGHLLAETKREDAAEKCYRQGIVAAAEDATLHAKLGKLLATRERKTEAMQHLRKAIALDPQNAEAHFNLGLVLAGNIERGEEAEVCMRKAIAIRPQDADSHYFLGNLLHRLRRFADSEAAYRQAIALLPGYIDAHSDLGLLLYELKRFDEAEASFRRVLSLDPNHGTAMAFGVHAMRQACSWHQLADAELHLLERLRQDDSLCISPFPLLALAGMAPDMIKRAGFRWAAQECRTALASPPVAEIGSNVAHRLRIGYLSADFRDHPVARLVAPVLEAHDHARFAVHGYAIGPDAADALRSRIRGACEVFRHLDRISEHDAARIIAQDDIDILVDLGGYTANAGISIVAMRPAPIVVSWLGYPGTLGHPQLADYLLGDPIVTPPEHAAHFSETLALMPHCYLPVGSPALDAVPTRQAVGLPESGFVFCSFNQSFKFSPDLFDVWCRLLKAVPDSVLWLPHFSAMVSGNLRREAAQRGIDAGRLVFAPRVPRQEQHIERLQLADLALDTYPYGSHTTGGDALSVGVPMVTRRGDTFPSRVAASLLHAVGMPELVTDSWDAYFALARELALDRDRYGAVRSRLAAVRSSAPLFDTAQFARDLEALYRRMWMQHTEGGVGRGVLAAASGTETAAGR